MSRYKLILGYELVTVYKLGRSRMEQRTLYKLNVEAISSHGAEINLRADEGVRVKI